ncbi:hypothetical protein [Azohydromonas lata]|uniref:hypothetical protein n=1 Tax=Azohydromonas lata TaxID=45677 RepID=UPI0012F51B28|nr:hypothetical protein [Azohydromonas lata]
MDQFFDFTAAISARLGMDSKDFNGHVIAFLAGIAAATFGFLLTMMWDAFKRRQDERAKYKNILGLIRAGLGNNAASVRWNVDMIEREENSIITRKTALNAPLASLKENFTGLLILGVPDKFLRNEKFIEKISDIDQNASIINRMIVARDIYKNSSGFQSGFQDNVLVHNRAIKSSLESFEKLNTEMIDFMAGFN